MASCVRDPCGLLCILLTYLSLGYADYVILRHILLHTFSGSIWCPLHAVGFNLIVFMLLACHTRAVFSDPGMVPLPETAIDFSDLRSTPRKSDRSNEDWTVCNRCETYRPPRAHHCRICHRCIRRMDHHCPWINNCVGELNQKYFIQFLFYTDTPYPLQVAVSPVSVVCYRADQPVCYEPSPGRLVMAREEGAGGGGREGDHCPQPRTDRSLYSAARGVGALRTLRHCHFL
ncbi:palmitoyltransferase ZDHHC3-like isoform X2 [Pseudophryne corroboree]|uniref:palmitoyltransferase ZDHHC3-like isoform X2 n=1 Tax=Pseudophryne corroboree TaxID=495146 RepID=UPI003081E7DD